jgi:putative transposase
MRQQGNPGIEAMCRLAGVSRAGFYRSLKETEPDSEEMAARAAIQEVALGHGRRYGYRRVTAELRAQGMAVNHKRVVRLMREDNLLAIRSRKFVSTTNSEHELEVYLNLAARMEVTGINQLWVSDITYVRLKGEFVYVAVILDAFSRRVVGWNADRTLHTRLALVALERAIAGREPAPGLVHHSDRGVQYASDAYVKFLRTHGLVPSMSRPGNPYDNAMCESFMKTLKQEEIYCTEYETLEHLEAAAGSFIENYYNRRRLHSALGYKSPEAFEALARSAPDIPWSAPKLSFWRHGEIFPSDEGGTLNEREGANLRSAPLHPSSR